MRLLPAEYLPDDYKGPNAGTEKEVIGDDDDIFFGHHLQNCCPLVKTWFHVQLLQHVACNNCIQQLHIKPHLKQEAFEKCWPIRHCEPPLHCHSPGVATVAGQL